LTPKSQGPDLELGRTPRSWRPRSSSVPTILGCSTSWRGRRRSPAGTMARSSTCAAQLSSARLWPTGHATTTTSPRFASVPTGP